jgi:hypothetical protein
MKYRWSTLQTSTTLKFVMIIIGLYPTNSGETVASYAVVSIFPPCRLSASKHTMSGVVWGCLRWQHSAEGYNFPLSLLDPLWGQCGPLYSRFLQHYLKIAMCPNSYQPIPIPSCNFLHAPVYALCVLELACVMGTRCVFSEFNGRLHNRQPLVSPSVWCGGGAEGTCASSVSCDTFHIRFQSDMKRHIFGFETAFQLTAAKSLKP